MPRSVTCPDGTVVRGDTDDELVAGVEAWLARANPRLAGMLSRREILAGAVEDEPQLAASSRPAASEASSRAAGRSR